MCLCRVIALAWKKLDAELTPSQITALSREEIECGLTFGGFAVFHCPLKEDSEPALRMLKVSLTFVPICARPHPHSAQAHPSSFATSIMPSVSCFRLVSIPAEHKGLESRVQDFCPRLEGALACIKFR